MHPVHCITSPEKNTCHRRWKARFTRAGSNANGRNNTALSLSAKSYSNSMPGTIEVSVVELIDIPSSATPSSCSSAFSVKIAMGKREFQTCDKGNFSFPLTTLRDNLIVTLHDANGNEITRIDVPPMSVVQRGVWDDLFSFHGGGLVRMKLQFILSQEERKRIQDMRYSALEKKKEELVKSNNAHLETRVNLSAVGLQEIDVKATSAPEKLNRVSILDAIQIEQLLQLSSDSKGHQQAEMAPDVGRTVSADSLSQEIHNDGRQSSQVDAFCFTEASHDGFEENQSSDTITNFSSINQKPISSQESLDSSLLYCVPPPPSSVGTGNRSSVPCTPGEDATCKPEMKNLMARSPSSVREMISAFETKRSVTDGGQDPHMGRLDRSQIIRSKMGSSSKDTLVEETSLLFVSTRGLEESVIKNPKVDKSFYAKNQEHKMHSKLASGEKTLADDARPVDPVSKQKFNSLNVRSHMDIDVLIDEIKLDQCSNPQQSKNNSTRRKDQDDSKNGSFKLLGEKHKTAKGMSNDKDMVESNLCLGLYDGGRKPCRADPNSPTHTGALQDKQEQVVECLFDSPWNWILQETRCTCITIASKQQLYAIEGSCFTKTERQPSSVNLSAIEEEKLASHTFRKSNPADSTQVSISPQALIAQAIKVGIVVVCGGIFVGSRQRKSRSLESSSFYFL